MGATFSFLDEGLVDTSMLLRCTPVVLVATGVVWMAITSGEFQLAGSKFDNLL